MTKPVLYSYFRSSCAYRVRIALALKGIEYDYEPVNLVKDGGQQRTDEYSQLNPMKQVPTLIIDGHTLTQSLPIIEYLEETHKGTALLPEEPWKRAKIRAIAEIINAGIQPIQNLSVLQKYTEDGQKRQEWGKYWIDKGFTALEHVLMETSGKYCFGDEISLADVVLVPQLYNAERFKVDMSKFPTISKVTDALSSHEAFKAAHPGRQPDCPEDLRIK